METVFENHETIKRKDIPLQFGRAVLFLIACFFISKIKFINEELSFITLWIMGIGLILLFTFQILTSKTIKRIEKDINTGKLIFIFERQLRSEFKIELTISNIEMEIRKSITRSSFKKILHITDQRDSLKIDTKMKGISAIELDKIISVIKIKTHNNI